MECRILDGHQKKNSSKLNMRVGVYWNFTSSLTFQWISDVQFLLFLQRGKEGDNTTHNIAWIDASRQENKTENCHEGITITYDLFDSFFRKKTISRKLNHIEWFPPCPNNKKRIYLEVLPSSCNHKIICMFFIEVAQIPKIRKASRKTICLPPCPKKTEDGKSSNTRNILSDRIHPLFPRQSNIFLLRNLHGPIDQNYISCGEGGTEKTWNQALL